MKNNTWIIVGVLALALIGIFALAGNDNEKKEQVAVPVQQEETQNPPSGAIQAGVDAGISAGINSPRETAFTLSASNFKFDQNTLRVKQGDRVTITLRNNEGVHDVKIDGYNIQTKQLNAAGQSDSITFVADKKGTFEYYCTVGQHRSMGMKGSLIVE